MHQAARIEMGNTMDQGDGLQAVERATSAFLGVYAKGDIAADLDLDLHAESWWLMGVTWARSNPAVCPRPCCRQGELFREGGG